MFATGNENTKVSLSQSLPPPQENLRRCQRDLLHNAPPLLLLLLLHTHHLSVVAKSRGGRGLFHPLESLVEPAADEAWRVPGHFGVAGATLAVVLAATLVVGEVVEETAVGGGGLGEGSLLVVLYQYVFKRMTADLRSERVLDQEKDNCR